MNWFKKLVVKWVREDWEKAQNEAKAPNMIGGTVRESEAVDIEGLRFTMMAAHGGAILQTRKYDNRTDRHLYNTYIIADGEEVAERVGQIVALELLRH